MGPAAILILVDCIAVRLVRYLLEILDQFLASRVHQQPYVPARGTQCCISQHDPFPHAWVGPWNLVSRPATIAHSEVLPHNLVIRSARGVLAVPRRVAIDHHAASMIGKPLFKCLAGFMCAG